MVLRLLRFAGALAILAVGAVHLQQYLGADYKAIPTIGPLFLLNAIGSGIVGLLLLLPLQRLVAGRRGDAAVALLAVTAVAIAIGSLIALFISESTSLFGFSETGYRAAIVVAIIAEAATIFLLGPVGCISSLERSKAAQAGPRDLLDPEPAIIGSPVTGPRRRIVSSRGQASSMPHDRLPGAHDGARLVAPPEVLDACIVAGRRSPTGTRPRATLSGTCRGTAG